MSKLTTNNNMIIEQKQLIFNKVYNDIKQKMHDIAKYALTSSKQNLLNLMNNICLNCQALFTYKLSDNQAYQLIKKIKDQYYTFKVNYSSYRQYVSKQQFKFLKVLDSIELPNVCCN